jgi:hypothetical protein
MVPARGLTLYTFFATHILWILGIVGGLSGAGLLVAIVAFGVPAAIIVAKAVDFFKAALQFFSTPFGQAVAIGLLCALVAFGADIRRARIDAKAWVKEEAQINADWQQKVDDAAEAFRSARQKRDEEVGADIAAAVQSKSSEIERLQQKVDTYEGADHPLCVLGPADLERVRGQQDRKPAATTKPKRPVKRWLDAIRHRG